MERVIISAKGETRDWSAHGSAFVRDLARELSEFYDVMVSVDKEDGTVVNYLYSKGYEVKYLVAEKEEELD